MSRTKSQPKAEKNPPSAVPVVRMPLANGPPGEVLTLAEAAAYLRLPEDEVVRLVNQQDLPGRYTGSEWRFSKPAIQAWLSQPPPKPSKEAVLAVIGSWKDDRYWEAELKEIYRQRGRPMTEEGNSPEAAHA
jgi:excisionase family DNA binding protein